MTGNLFLIPRQIELFLVVTTLCLCLPASNSCPAGQDNPPRYVGSKACKPCHEKEYSSFIRYAKKNTTYNSIERLKRGLNKENLKKCYGWHTTGYGKPGGFISIEKTSELKNAGREVCHGPGGIHVKTKDPRQHQETTDQERLRNLPYFRTGQGLQVYTTYPPLSERREDIPLLAHHFIDKFNLLKDKNIE